MVQVKKRNGRIEEFVESKIATGVRKAGATAEEAAEVAKDVSAKVAHRVEVTAAEMSTMVVTSLRKVNRKASAEFVKFRDTKLKAKTKKELAKLALLSTTLKTKVE
jgi:transcriptional regulator NrdR family protein